MADTFPRQHARTQRLTLGAPRTFAVAPDGARVLFLRSRGGADGVTCLWALEAGGAERLVADPTALLAASPGEGELPEAERRRRERARETAGGVVAYAHDAGVRRACFALAGRLFTVELDSGEARELPAAGPVFDPRLDPTGERIAYVSGQDLRVVEIAGGNDRRVAGEDAPEVSWGSAEFVAAEEMGRTRGFWWSPDGRALAAARVDVTPVPVWWIADPAHPERAPSPVRYPAAGEANAEVTLAVLDLDAGHGAPVELTWDRAAYPYLADVRWDPDSPLTLVVQSRDQRRLAVLTADPATGLTQPARVIEDPSWVELTPGAPRWCNGALLTLEDRDGARRLCADGAPLTPPELQVRSVVGLLGGAVVVAASPDPLETHLYRVGEQVEALTAEPGVHAGACGGGALVVLSAGMDHDGQRVEVRWPEGLGGGPTLVASYAEAPLVTARPSFAALGARALRSALLLPSDPAAAAGPLPVLLDPYGGPHAQRVVRSRNAHAASQWFADQGFAVVVVDGRGTPARGPEWERAVRGDLAGPVLEDQIDALHALASADDRLDLGRVGIRGWSFGGYLAALAVLRRPDVFHAAVAGAPVTDWRLYDTHYTERYLGLPAQDPAAYARTDLTAEAAALRRPLLLVHGLADDNVVAAHTLRLSSALLAAGRAHQVLPLSGVTHMTPQEVVAENLLLLQVAFLKAALAAPEPLQ